MVNHYSFRLFFPVLLSYTVAKQLKKTVYSGCDWCGLYTDNGNKYKIKAGEAVICLDGDEHGICNKEKEELLFIALVVNSLRGGNEDESSSL